MDEAKIITIERTFDAPVERVWAAWTDTEQIAKWFGPRGFSARVEQNDLRVGGRWRYVMIQDETGEEFPSEGTFKELVDQQKIVTTDEFAPDFPQDPDVDLPQGLVQHITFEALGQQTKVKIVIEHPTAEEKDKHAKMGVVEGYGEQLDKFAEFLAK